MFSFACICGGEMGAEINSILSAVQCLQCPFKSNYLCTDKPVESANLCKFELKSNGSSRE